MPNPTQNAAHRDVTLAADHLGRDGREDLPNARLTLDTLRIT